MKKFAVTLIIISFISISLFGYFGMFNGTMSGYEKCLASLFHGASCPADGEFHLFNVHMNLYKSFSQGLEMAFAALTLILAMMFVAANRVIFQCLISKFFVTDVVRKYSFHFKKSPHIFWLELLERKDAAETI